jgi:hypothetical protein
LPLAKTIASGGGLGVEESTRPVRVEILFENLAINRFIVDNQNLESAGQRIHRHCFVSTFRAKISDRLVT